MTRRQFDLSLSISRQEKPGESLIDPERVGALQKGASQHLARPIRFIETGEGTVSIESFDNLEIDIRTSPEQEALDSRREGAEEATAEIKDLISLVKSDCLPERVNVSVLFAPTGPLQEVSLSSGWADPFLKLADKYDQVEKLLWKNS